MIVSRVPEELIKRLVTQEKNKSGAYPKELRAFAMTLKFYSAKAYKFVRKSFNLGLPDPSVISSWYNVMVGEPGFTKEVMTALKAKVLAEKQDGQEIFARRCWMRCPHASMFNGMARRVRQFVDPDDDSLPKATKAVVFIGLCEFACTFIIMCKLGAAAEHAINNCET